VDDVTLGVGTLAGSGVYAARDFSSGDVVVTYQLQPLNEVDYLGLPAGEDLFVHSFGGRRYLYPAPARFVNHSDDPSCFQDFDRCCNIALRPIAKGQPITIDSNHETARELDTFLDAYHRALDGRSVPLLGALVDTEACLGAGTGIPRSGRSCRRAAQQRPGSTVECRVASRYRTLGSHLLGRNRDCRGSSAPHDATQDRRRQLADGLPAHRLNRAGAGRSRQQRLTTRVTAR
jgi:hypothetical protein